MGQWYINKGCGRPYYQIMGRKKKKVIQGILWSMGEFCQNCNFSSTNASISEGSEFLLILYKKGLSYSVSKPARSTLSMILPPFNGTEFGKHLIIAHVLKGIFRNRHAFLWYMVNYDPDLVLNFLKSLPSWDNITLKWLTLKTVTILALLAHRDIDVNQ